MHPRSFARIGALFAAALMLMGPAEAGRFRLRPKLSTKLKPRAGVQSRVYTRTGARPSSGTRTWGGSQGRATGSGRANASTRADGSVRVNDGAGNVRTIDAVGGSNGRLVSGGGRTKATWVTKDGNVHQRLSDNSRIVIRADGTRVRTMYDSSGAVTRTITVSPKGKLTTTNGAGQTTRITRDGARARIDTPGPGGRLPADPKPGGWTREHTRAAIVGTAVGTGVVWGASELLEGDDPASPTAPGASGTGEGGFPTPPGTSEWDSGEPPLPPGSGSILDGEKPETPGYDELIVVDEGTRVRSRKDQDQDRDQDSRK